MDTANDIIQALRKIDVTEDLLKETKIGIVVNKLSKRDNKKIASAAKELVDNWRSALRKIQPSSGTVASESKSEFPSTSADDDAETREMAAMAEKILSGLDISRRKV